MNVAGVALMILALVMCTIAFAYMLLRTYIDRRESSALTSFISTMAVSITLLCVMLIPVDIYIVSSDLNSDGSQSDPGLTERSANALQSVYYGLYILLLVFAFILLPFTYFYFEEDSEDSTVMSRTCSASKYTAGFIVFFLVLLALGLVLKKGKQDDDPNNPDWKRKLSNDFTNGEAILSFCIGCLACFGLVAYVVYAAYGLARVPLKLMSKAKVVRPSLVGSAPSDGSKQGLLASSKRKAAMRLNERDSEEDLELSLRRNQENLQYLQSQYDLSGRPWSAEDKRQLEELRKEQRRLQALRQNKLRTGGRRVNKPADAPPELTCWDKCWNILVPIRLVIAIPLLLISLLLVVSLSITVVDKFKHSLCGASCGYTLAKTQITNPIDEAFRELSKAFPIDCIFFAGLVLYIFMACVSGIVGLGVRFFVVKLYSVHKGATAPNAFLMAAWMLQLMALALNMEMITIAPTYATFGNQFYLNTTSNERTACDADLIDLLPNTCIQTQIGKFINTMAVETPFFSVVLFYGNLGFLAFFLLFLVWGIFGTSKREEMDSFRKLAAESDSD